MMVERPMRNRELITIQILKKHPQNSFDSINEKSYMTLTNYEHERVQYWGQKSEMGQDLSIHVSVI